MREFPSGNLSRPIKLIKGSPTIVLRGNLAQPSRVAIQPVYAKLLTPSGRSIESVCAWLGAAYGLPLPAAAIAEVHRNKLPHGVAWPFAESAQSERCFATAEVPFGQPVAGIADREIASRLARWPRLVDAAIFDFFIANDDRHDDNLLLDPAGEFWMIDHQRSLGGAGNRLFSDPFPSFRPTLLDCVKEVQRDPIRLRRVVSDACARLIAVAGRIPYDRLGVTEEFADQAEQILSRRAEVLLAFVLDHLGMPELFASRSVWKAQQLQ